MSVCRIFATLETSGSLGRVWLRKGFWDCYRGRKSRSQEENVEETSVSKLGGEIRATENDIPDGKLVENVEDCNCVQMKRWLLCRGGKTLYYSLVYPYLYYCTIAWGSTYPSNLNRLVLLQKRVIRIISKDTHTDPIFRDLKLLRLDQIYLYQLGKFRYLYSSGSLAEYFHNYFPMTNEVPSYNTRSTKIISPVV